MDRNHKPVRTRFPPSVKVTVRFLEPNELDELRKCSGAWAGAEEFNVARGLKAPPYNDLVISCNSCAIRPLVVGDFAQQREIREHLAGAEDD